MRIKINGKQFDTDKNSQEEIAAIIKRILAGEKFDPVVRQQQDNVSTFRYLNTLAKSTEGTAG